MHLKSKGTSVLFWLLAICAPVQAGSDSLETTGDILQILIPAAALGKTYFDDDQEGRLQFWKSAGTTFGVVHGTKALAGKLRPSRANTSSFPSGHTASAFTGAAFLHHRYGLAWGAPAYALAGVVGYSRIDADAHYADDVLAGANVAILSSLFFVSAEDSAVSNSPLQSDGLGVTVTMTNEGLSQQRKLPGLYEGKWRYSFQFGPAYLKKNIIGIPETSGSSVDIEDFDGENDPLTTALSVVEYQYNQKQSYYASFVPYELREVTSLENTVTLGGREYKEAEKLRVQYRLYDAVLGWQYKLIDTQNWHLNAGVDLSVQRTLVKFTSEDAGRAGASDWTAVLSPSFELQYRVTPRLSAFANASASDYSDSELLNAEAGLRWQMDRRWDAAFKIARYKRKTDSGELENDLKVDSALLELGYRF